MRYTVAGDCRLYIDGRWRKPGQWFDVDGRLPNEASLMEAGHILTVDECTALVKLDVEGLSSADIVDLSNAMTAPPGKAKAAAAKAKHAAHKDIRGDD